MTAGGDVFLDEIGIAIGIWGDVRLKSRYQPVFSCAGDLLRPTAAHCSLAAFLWGEPLSLDSFLAGLDGAQRCAVERLGRRLHIENLVNTGVEGLQLMLSFDPALETADQLVESVAAAADVADSAWVDPALIVCEMALSPVVGRDRLAAAIAAIRQHGFRVGLSDGQADLNLAQVRPDAVRLDGANLFRLGGDAAALRLARSLVANLRARGVESLVDGIEDADMLAAALDAGAAMAQGGFLARPALAGAVFDDAPRALSQPAARHPVIVPFRRRRL